MNSRIVWNWPVVARAPRREEDEAATIERSDQNDEITSGAERRIRRRERESSIGEEYNQPH